MDTYATHNQRFAAGTLPPRAEAPRSPDPVSSLGRSVWSPQPPLFFHIHAHVSSLHLLRSRSLHSTVYNLHVCADRDASWYAMVTARVCGSQSGAT